MSGSTFYEFYAPHYLRDEIWEHKDKIKKTAGINDDEFFEIYELVLKNITVLNHSLVDKLTYEKAFELCEDIDVADTIFVAFAKFLQCKLWMGDKKLIKGLQKKGFAKVIATEDLFLNFVKNNMK